MADSKISALASATVPLGSGDVTVVVQGGVDKKVPLTPASLGLGGTGTVTASGGAATLNKPAGIVTSESLTAATSYTLTLTNSVILTGSVVLVTATNSANLLVTIDSVTESAGQVVIVVSMAALTGTVIFRYAVFN